MKLFCDALAIFALAISACAPILPMQKAELPMQTPTALAIPTRTLKPTPTPKNAVAKVTAAQSLHVRIRPGERQPLAEDGYLYHGETVILTGKCETGWAEIEWNGGTAWVNARFLSKNNCMTKEGE